MGLVGVEAVKLAMKTKLQTDMAAKIVALNAEYADAYVLTEVPAASYYTHRPTLRAPSFEFPAIALIDDGHVPIRDQSGPAFYVVEYTVIVGIVIRGDDAAQLTAFLERQTRALKEILVARHSLAPTCTTCEWVGTWNASLTDPDSGDLLQDMSSRFLVTTAEATS